MKRIALFTGLVLVTAVSALQAESLEISPTSQEANVGSPVQADLVVGGLQGGATSTVGAFDLDVNFSPDVLAYEDFEFGSGLDVSQEGSERGVNAETAGTVSVYEVSLADPEALDAAQGSNVTLGTLSFDALAVGESPLTISNAVLTDAEGNRLLLPDGPVNGVVTVALPFDQLDGLTPSQESFGGAVQIACAQLRTAAGDLPLSPAQEDLLEQCNDLVEAAAGDEESQSAAADAIAATTPQQVLAPSSLSARMTSAQTANVSGRLASVRGDAAGPPGGGLTLRFDDRTIAWPLAMGREERGGGASADEAGLFGRTGFWVNGAVSFGDKDATTNEDSYDFDTAGITAGADYLVTDAFLLGAAVGYANTDIDIDRNGGNVDANGWALSAYGNYDLGENFYLDGSASYSWRDFDQKRKFAYQLPENPAVIRTANADYDGTGYTLGLGAGYDYYRGPTTLGAYGRLYYANSDIDGYTERNALGWDTAVADQEVKSFTSTLGGRVSHPVNTRHAVLLPQAWAEWVHEFEDSDDIGGTLVNAIDPSATGYTLFADKRDPDYFRVGAGVSARFAGEKTAFLRYQTTLGLEDFSNHSFVLGFRADF